MIELDASSKSALCKKAQLCYDQLIDLSLESVSLFDQLLLQAVD